MSDPRAGFTSASNAAADKLCAGRHLAQRGLPEIESKDARTGTLIHLAFAGDKDTLGKLSKQERKTVVQAKKIENFMVVRWWETVRNQTRDLPFLDADVQRRAIRGQRFWAHMKSQPCHSGEIDAFWLSGDMKHAIIEDLKSLWGEVEDPDFNRQIRDYAALLWENYQLESVCVFIVQPNVVWDPMEVKLIQYNRADLERSHKEMLARVLASNDIKAKRTPGPVQCKFCRAAGTDRCPESTALFLKGSEDLSVPKWDQLTPKERGAFITDLKFFADTAEKMLKEVKARIAEDPNCVEGWKIGRGKKLRSIDDILAVGQILRECYGSNFTSEMLMKACKLSVPKLEELHQALCGHADKAAAQEFRGRFGHLISEKITEGALEKTK